MKKLIVIGPFPPPVHGMSKNLLEFCNALPDHVDVLRINTSPGILDRGLKYHWNKFRCVLKGAIRYLAVRGVSVAYLPPDGGFGVWYSLLFIIISRLKGVDVFLHHRSFQYIDKKSLGMSLICYLLSGRCHHIFLCDVMRLKFFQIYPLSEYRIISNAGHIEHLLTSTSDKHFSKKLTLGFLSNISISKGILSVIETYRKILLVFPDAVLKIGGDFDDEITRNIVLREIIDLHAVNFCGFVSNKAEFYSDVNFFLFPTNYVNEAQPNVLFEALATECMVISVSKGCIEGDLSDGIGYLIPLEQYPDVAAQIVIENWNDRNILFSRVIRSKVLISRCCRDAKIAYVDLIRTISRMLE